MCFALGIFAAICFLLVGDIHNSALWMPLDLAGSISIGILVSLAERGCKR